MVIRGLRKLEAIGHRVMRRLARGPRILMYHRIADLSQDPQLLAVSPKHFSEHLEVIRRYGNVVGLEELVRTLQKGPISHKALVVTLDDGYADNLYQAKPILERFNIPATVYIRTGFIEGGHEFFSDELERLLLQPGTLPELLRLSIRGKMYEWKLGEETEYNKDIYRNRSAWNVLKLPPGQRQSIYLDIHKLLRPLSGQERQAILDDLRALIGIDKICRFSHQAMTWNEIRELEKGGLVEIGAHTVTHPLLALLPISEQRVEIQNSKTNLEVKLGHAITKFAYPYGYPTDYSSKTVALVKEAGFICACAAFPGRVISCTDLFQLPRFVVRNWSGDEFERLFFYSKTN